MFLMKVRSKKKILFFGKRALLLMQTLTVFTNKGKGGDETLVQQLWLVFWKQSSFHTNAMELETGKQN